MGISYKKKMVKFWYQSLLVYKKKYNGPNIKIKKSKNTKVLFRSFCRMLKKKLTYAPLELFVHKFLVHSECPKQIL